MESEWLWCHRYKYIYVGDIMILLKKTIEKESDPGVDYNAGT